MVTILVVDDDPIVLKGIKMLLERQNFRVITAGDGEEALSLLVQERPDLLVLDIMMPGVDGLTVCRRIRADPFISKTPILFLTAKSRSIDLAEGLDAGADDYVTKPLEVVELPARIRALLRRAPQGPLDPESEYIVVGDLKLSRDENQLWVKDRVIALTPLEYQLAHYLMLYAGQPVTSDRLLEAIWHYPPGTEDANIVRVHIANLRSKIEPDPDNPHYIRNIRGRGYLLGGD